MIDYTHPARPARHAACHTWDDRGHACRGSHDCDIVTIVSNPAPWDGRRYVLTGTGTDDVRTYAITAPAGRGAHRPAPVSLVKA